MNSPDVMLRAGCTTHRGLRFWEDQGLLGEVGRSSGGTRQYTDEQLERVRIIAAAQFGGFDLDTIGKMLGEYHTGMEVYDALTERLANQIQLAARLAEALPKPRAPSMEFDL